MLLRRLAPWVLARASALLSRSDSSSTAFDVEVPADWGATTKAFFSQTTDTLSVFSASAQSAIIVDTFLAEPNSMHGLRDEFTSVLDMAVCNGSEVTLLKRSDAEWAAYDYDTPCAGVALPSPLRGIYSVACDCGSLHAIVYPTQDSEGAKTSIVVKGRAYGAPYPPASANTSESAAISSVAHACPSSLLQFFTDAGISSTAVAVPCFKSSIQGGVLLTWPGRQRRPEISAYDLASGSLSAAVTLPYIRGTDVYTHWVLLDVDASAIFILYSDEGEYATNRYHVNMYTYSAGGVVLAKSWDFAPVRYEGKYCAAATQLYKTSVGTLRAAVAYQPDSSRGAFHIQVDTLTL